MSHVFQPCFHLKRQEPHKSRLPLVARTDGSSSSPPLCVLQACFILAPLPFSVNNHETLGTFAWHDATKAKAQFAARDDDAQEAGRIVSRHTGSRTGADLIAASSHPKTTVRTIPLPRDKPAYLLDQTTPNTLPTVMLVVPTFLALPDQPEERPSQRRKRCYGRTDGTFFKRKSNSTRLAGNL